MAPVPDRPKDSTAEESYKIGEKVYYHKGGKIASLLDPQTAENAGLIEGWRRGEVTDLDSESSSNPVYHVRTSRKLWPQSTLKLQTRSRTKATIHLTREHRIGWRKEPGLNGGFQTLAC